MNNLQRLHGEFDQSPWLDNLSRDLLQSGQLQAYIDQGIRGLTSNPTIMEAAIKDSSAYDEQIKQLAAEGLDDEAIYWRLVEDDIKQATALLRPIWEESGGEDGYVSLEVSPRLANDGEATIDQAKRLWQEVNQPNLMIKVPATDAGIPTISQLLSVGINVNVTLIFSLDHYRTVAEAHKASHQLGFVNNSRSVASFFISRVDTEVDKRLEAIGGEALNLRGQAAVAQAHLAYKIFDEYFKDALHTDADGSAIQRLLWASTSAKNPAYEDLIYVRYLVAPNTINTLPEATIALILDHLPTDTRVINSDDIAHAEDVMRRIAEVGVDLDDVAHTLEAEGVAKFEASYTSLLEAIARKR